MDVSKLCFKTQIVLQKQVYFSGEVMRGQVIVINGTGESQRLRERISISFDGFSKTNLEGRKVTKTAAGTSALVWANRRNSIGQEVYMQAKIFLTPEDSDTVELAPGHNGFPFQFELPSFLPSSFFSTSGAVNYEATTSFSLGHYYAVECSNKVIFRVINSQDLNLHSLAGLNSYFSFEKLIPMKSSIRSSKQQQFGLVNTTVQIPSQGYVPGEYIKLTMQIFYPDGLQIQKVFVELISETTYSCPSGTAMDSDVLSQCNAVRPKWGKQGHLTAQLEIPPQTLPSTSHSSYLIAIKYFVLIKIQLPTGMLAITVGRFPVIIGTIPLLQIQTRTSSLRERRPGDAQRALELEGAVGGDIYRPSAPALCDTLSDDDTDIPPSYLEAVTMSNGSSPLPAEFLAEEEN